MTRALIIGYGSIGKRHARILSELKCQVAVVSEQKFLPVTTYTNVVQACRAESPDYIVVANSTDRHFDTLNAVFQTGYDKRILIEKPIFSQSHQISYPTDQLRVGYQLRFDPIVKAFRRFCNSNKLYSITSYAGQYLPLWREGRGYTASYSSSKERGGGVLRDLSHEIDYLQWCSGPLSLVGATGGHLSNLEGDSEDTVSFILRGKDGAPLSVTLNYLDQPKGRRFVIAHGASGTFYGDLVNRFFDINGVRTDVSLNRDDAFQEMHSSFLAGKGVELCSYVEGLEVVKLIEEIEQRML